MGILSRPTQLYPPANSTSPKIYRPKPRRPSSHLVKVPTSPKQSFTSNMVLGGVPRPIKKPRKILYLVVIFFLLYWFGVRHGLGIERAPPPPLGFAVPGGRKHRKTSLSWGKLGMASVKPTIPGVKLEHPIYELMEKAETRWNTLLAAQSTTLEEAVATYRRRYHIAPPKGFEDWFQWCLNHDIKIVDEYDQLMKDILPHHALRPEIFMERSKALEGSGFTYTLDIKAGKKLSVDVTGERAKNARPNHMRNLIMGFIEELPKDFELKVTGSDHDTGSQILGRDQRERAMELVKLGQHFTDAELKHLEDPHRTPAWGWFKACPLDSPANIKPGAENATTDATGKTFIYDHRPTMDFCDYPELKRLHGAMHIDYDHRSPSVLKPILVLSKFPGDSSFQITPMEAYNNITEDELPYLGKWEDKTDNRLFWRGSTTGGYNVHRDWRESHRLRLHLMINGEKGKMDEYQESRREVMVPITGDSYLVEERRDELLSKGYTDVKLSGGPVQCPTPALCDELKEKIEFGDKVWPAEASKYKYALDVDGNGWSSRFHRLLTTASPVVKMTMFPEWNMESLTPWYHYIPLKPDYSDLYDIMAFFIGPMDEDGNVDTTQGHDYLAKKIGEAGQRFALDHWSWKDMQAYTYRLLLELRRLHTLNRSSMDYRPGI